MVYGEKTKVDAVIRVDMGESIADVARDVGAHKDTVSRWCRDPRVRAIAAGRLENAQTLSEAAATNSRRDTLVALRDKLAVAIESCDSGRDIAALSKRLMEVMGELDALPDPSAGKNPARRMREMVKSRGGPA